MRIIKNILFLLYLLCLGPSVLFAAEADIDEDGIRLRSYRFSPPDASQKLGVQQIVVEPDMAEAFPEKAFLGHYMKGMGVLNQGPLGSCTANACAYAVYGRSVATDAPPIQLSRLGLYYWAREDEGRKPMEDSGTSLYADFRVLTGLSREKIGKGGYFSEEFWTYDPSKRGSKPKFSQEPPKHVREKARAHHVLGDLGLLWVGPDLDRIKGALLNDYPVPFGMLIADSFEHVGKDGNIPYASPSVNAYGHAMCFIGYNDIHKNLDGTDGALTFINSWGDEWGQRGKGHLPYSMLSSVLEAWAVAGVSGAPEAGYMSEHPLSYAPVPTDFRPEGLEKVSQIS